jgi:hypothetical protein
LKAAINSLRQNRIPIENETLFLNRTVKQIVCDELLKFRAIELWEVNIDAFLDMLTKEMLRALIALPTKSEMLSIRVDKPTTTASPHPTPALCFERPAYENTTSIMPRKTILDMCDAESRYVEAWELLNASKYVIDQERLSRLCSDFALEDAAGLQFLEARECQLLADCLRIVPRGMFLKIINK